MKKIRAVLFDFDGTLSDLVPRWIMPVVETIKEIRPDISDQQIKDAFSNNSKEIVNASTGFSPFIGVKVVWVIGKIVGLSFIERIKLLGRLRKKKDAFKRIIPFPDTVFTIRALSQMGYELALISTASRGTLERAIQVIPDLVWFSVIISRDDVLQTKPNPEPFEKAIEIMGVSKEECIYVGDLPIDVEGANNCGISSVLVLRQWGENVLNQFPDMKPDLVINELSDLVNIGQTGFQVFKE